jgi:hypothetical protein
MPEDDKKFEAALAGFFHRESRDDAARLLCPDPELLAAYHERALSSEESQAMQLHVAGCSRCQEVLAQLDATENLPLETVQADAAVSAGAAPQTFHGQDVRDITQRGVSAAPPGSSRSPRQWRWIAPAGAIAASLLVWIAYRELRPPQQAPANAVRVAENRKEMDMPAASTPSPNSATPQPAPNKLVPQKPEQPLTTRNLPRKIGRFDSSKSPADNEPKTRTYDDLAARQSVEIQSDALEKAIVPKYAPKARAKLPLENGNIRMPAAAPAPPAGAAAKSATAEAVEVSSAERLRDKVVGAAYAQTNSTLILTPDAAAIWRVGAAGSIEFSSSGGGQWQRQASGVTVELISGFAPQTNVCWIVGRSGTILLTTDSGTTWRKISSPTNNDLGGVHASDALHATISELTSQKKFETADGGQTWHPVAGQ